MSIIFVGVHNKPGLDPLCSLTKSGKLIDRIIERIDVKCVKSNLFNIDRLPIYEEKYQLIDEWYWKHLPTNDDIIVLLGGIVHKEFNFPELNIIKLAHPSSIWGHKKMNNYVDYESQRINETISKRNTKRIKRKPTKKH